MLHKQKKKTLGDTQDENALRKAPGALRKVGVEGRVVQGRVGGPDWASLIVYLGS